MEKNGSKESLKPTFNKNNANLPIVPQNLHDPATYFRQTCTKLCGLIVFTNFVEIDFRFGPLFRKGPFIKNVEKLGTV